VGISERRDMIMEDVSPLVTTTSGKTGRKSKGESNEEEHTWRPRGKGTMVLSRKFWELMRETVTGKKGDFPLPVERADRGESGRVISCAKKKRGKIS